jgi:hypothetical protein
MRINAMSTAGIPDGRCGAPSGCLDQCAEHGYMLVPIAFQSIVSGDFANTRILAERAAQIGRRRRS